MFLETICDAIDLETLIGVLRRHYQEMWQWRGATPPAAHTDLPTIGDVTLLKSLLPETLFRLMYERNEMGQFALTFALRHRLTYINTLFHSQALALQHIATDFSPLDLIFGRELSSDRLNLAPMLAAKHWLVGGAVDDAMYLPVIGFSPAGMHILAKPVGHCRAFDRHEVHCGHPTAGTFCEKHQDEVWWAHEGKVGSTQAQMYRFFAATKNFHEFDAAKLAKLLSEFWASYQVWKRDSSPGRIEAALKLFSLHDEQELLRLGTIGLRERYLLIAMTAHPDHGGKNEQFLHLKDSYQALRRRLEWKLAS